MNEWVWLGKVYIAISVFFGLFSLALFSVLFVFILKMFKRMMNEMDKK